MFLMKFPNDVGHDRAKDGLTSKADSKLTYLTFRAESSYFLRSLGLPHHCLRFGQKRPAGACQFSPVRKTVKEWRPEFIFQRSDLLTERRLANAHILGRPSKVLLLSNCQKIANMT